ncbi:inositol-3-phosphate synthase [Desulfomarina profundi]|uniref:Inositol-3-phosphate synthase n=1 Tax=Desulfomarina profundi TaxID=2772557 RepID=A0A8D5JNG5_9BACT|nr:inositol-3-phosphate synthase [Desulfomarina profundi]BCL60110.1 inositol-3-phosphate synthase [Desulfomarina profundi]
MSKIKVGIIGVGNCASSLIQGINHYGKTDGEDAIGLMHWKIGRYKPTDIEIVSAFDIDRRKVGLDINQAIFAKPNCTKIFCPEIAETGTVVKMGKILDGFSDHMKDYNDESTFLPADEEEPDAKEIIEELQRTGTEVLMNYLPVGSEQATRFYANCALEAGVAFVNNIPVFIASDPEWSDRFKAKNIPIIGDDIKAQLGATIVHRALTDLFNKRGVKLERTYQLNTGGNTDFLNMLNQTRLSSKKESKTEAVQAVTAARLEKNNIHIGPSDYVAWQKDNKVCFIRMEGKLFGDVPMNIEMRLSVEDSPNSAGVAIDSIRCAKIALERKLGGALTAPSSYFCKHPPIQYTDDKAYQLMEEFISQDVQAIS